MDDIVFDKPDDLMSEANCYNQNHSDRIQFPHDGKNGPNSPDSKKAMEIEMSDFLSKGVSLFNEQQYNTKND